MQLVRFKTKCRKCRKKLLITLDQARNDQIVACANGHVTQARAAIENELIAGVNQGSRDYFECLVYIFDREVRGLIFRALQPWLQSDLASVETEDALQELYLSLWREGLRPIDKTLTAYIGGIAFHKAMDRMRKRRDSVMEPLTDHPWSTGLSLTEEQLVVGIDRGQLLQKLEWALSNLPHDQENVYRLRRLEGWSIKEVAEFLSIGLGTVKSRLSRAEEEIRKLLMTSAKARTVQ